MRRALIVSISLALTAGATLSPVLAAEDGSMDSIWVDQAVRDSVPQDSSEPAKADSAPPAAAPTPSATTANAGATTLDTAAPMCTVSAFKDSPLASGNGWAGLGPFKASGADSSEFVDDKQNRVKLDLSGDQITRAELTIANYKPSRDPYINLLNLQMNIDFLLESVGIKSSRIQNLNVQLERKKEALLKDPAPLSITTGRYAVTVDKHPGSDSVDYVIAVNSMDVNKKVIKQAWVPTEKPTAPANDTRISMTVPDIKIKPVTSDRGQLKAQFTELIANWQKIKRDAVKSRQPEQLQNVLSGRALVRQTDAVKWLLEHKRYYDMSPKGVVVEQFTEIIPAKKYMVAAQVHEAYKFIDEPTGKVLKERDDINKVNYTVERVGNKWVISDSNLLSANTTQATKIAR